MHHITQTHSSVKCLYCGERISSPVEAHFGEAFYHIFSCSCGKETRIRQSHMSSGVLERKLG